MKLLFVINLLLLPIFLMGQNITKLSSTNIEGKWVVDSILVYMKLGNIDFPEKNDTVKLDFSGHPIRLGGGFYERGSKITFKKDGIIIVNLKQKKTFNYKLADNIIFLSDKEYVIKFIKTDYFVIEGKTYSCGGCYFKMFLKRKKCKR